ncbi:MAG: 4-vinyl reductase [Chloroflexi bacterium]|nr:4-vinyl reductase [Chloroflexota bacterium]MBU1748585.1 4-vinyl reductase [Chloroflexota bacterium]
MAEVMLPNAALRTLLLAVEEVMGDKGTSAMLNAAGLQRFVGNYPPDNMNDEVPISDYAAVVKAIEDFYGPRGAKAFMLRIGRASFDYTIQEQPAILGLAGVALKLLPMNLKVKTTLGSFAKGMTDTLHEPCHLDDAGDAWLIIKDECGTCHGRTTDKPMCHTTTGALQQALKWASGQDFDVVETDCRAAGASTCTWRIGKEPRG